MKDDELRRDLTKASRALMKIAEMTKSNRPGSGSLIAARQLIAQIHRVASEGTTLEGLLGGLELVEDEWVHDIGKDEA